LFFDNDYPFGGYSEGGACYTDYLLMEAKVTLTKTNSLDPDLLFDI